MSARLAVAIGTALLSAAGCSSDPLATSPGAGGAGQGGTGGEAPVPVLDPKLFDCTASAPPERTTPVPFECVVDRGCETSLVTGHRGCGGQIGIIAPENTLAAVRAAIALGIELIETDPRPTSDGVLVNVHDTSVDRTTDGSGEVAEMTLAEVQALSIDASAYAGDFGCERIPTIEEVLLEARGKVHVLLDANKTDRVDLLVQAVQATDTLGWAIFDTSSIDKIDEALLLEPELMTMIRVEDEVALSAALSHFEGHPPVIVELSGGLELAEAVLAAGHRPFANAFGTDVAAGLDDDPSLYAPVFDAGVRIVQTDRPDLVLRFLGR